MRWLNMPAAFYVQLRKVGNSLVLTMPKQIADGNEWHKGDILLLTSEGEIVTVRKTKPAY